jgi:hypothetical protein
MKKCIVYIDTYSNKGDIDVNPFIQLSIFFDHRINKIPKEKSLRFLALRFLIHFVYNLFTASLVGLFISFFCILIISTFFNWSWNMDSNSVFLILPFFILICLTNILIINLKNHHFNFPRVVLDSYIIFKITKFYRKIVHSILGVLGSSILLFISLLPILYFVTIPKDLTIVIVLTLLIVSVLISFIIYSELTFNELDRSIRQLCLWSGAFFTMLALSIYKIHLIVNSEEQQWLELVLLILGLVFTMVTVLDKARLFCTIAFEEQKEDIEKLWNKLENTYSYSDLKLAIEKEKQEVDVVYQSIKKEWLAGKKEKVIRGIIYSLIFATIAILFMRLMDYGINKIDSLFPFLLKEIGSIYINYLFSGNKKLGIVILVLAILFYVFYSKISLIKGEKFSKIEQLEFYEIILTLGLGIFVLIGYLFNLLTEVYFLRIFLMPSAVLILFFSLLSFLMKRSNINKE